MLGKGVEHEGDASTAVEQVLAAVGRIQEASFIRHLPWGQALCDTLHLQADLGRPAMILHSHLMQGEPRFIEA